MIDVSVVMPIGSVEPELEAQLVALSAQDFGGAWELVLSLNTPGARTELERTLNSFNGRASVSIVDSSAVRSASHARNVGAAAAKADRIAFCDADDIADPAWLATMVAALEHHRAVGGFLEEELLAVPGQQNWRPPATPGGNPSFLGHDFLVSANMAIWADEFHDIGGFDESLLRGEDIAFSWALLRKGIELGYAADAIMHYRHRKGLWPMLKQHYLYGRGMSQILARIGTPDQADDSSQPAPLQRASFRANGQRVDKMSSVHILRRGSIAVGRVVGLVLEAIRSRRGAHPHG